MCSHLRAGVREAVAAARVGASSPGGVQLDGVAGGVRDVNVGGAKGSGAAEHVVPVFYRRMVERRYRIVVDECKERGTEKKSEREKRKRQ